jgi:hypothetical protein
MVAYTLTTLHTRNTGNAQHNECMISGFRPEADVHCPLHGYYAASSGNSIQAFKDQSGKLSQNVENKLPLLTA